MGEPTFIALIRLIQKPGVMKFASAFGRAFVVFQRTLNVTSGIRNNIVSSAILTYCLLTPPFAGDIKNSRIIHQFDIAKGPRGKWEHSVGREILFIGRNLEFLSRAAGRR